MKRHWSLLWAARFVAKWEGFSPHAYLDTIASPPVFTIGYGHTGEIHGRPIRSTDTVTKREARKILAADLRSGAKAVREYVKVSLSVRQRIALISLVFNVGPGVLVGTHLIAALNARHYEAAANRFLEWDHAGGVVVQGLLNRRRAERWLFLHNGHAARQVPVTPHAQLHTSLKKEEA